MTSADPMRSRAESARPEDSELDELVEGADPLACDACIARGDECHFHRGWAQGWDACAAFIARHVHAAAGFEPDEQGLDRGEDLR